MRTDESFANVVTVEFGCCRSHLNSVLQLHAVQWKSLLRALASGSPYPVGPALLEAQYNLSNLSTTTNLNFSEVD